MAFTYKDFNYDPYSESDRVKKYSTDLAVHEAAKPADWNGGTYGQSMNDAMNKVLNREKFKYDINGDALYQQYKNQYINQGKQAMMDTMGQAAALTGGYGNSYAQTVGQQTYQGYLQGLNDKIPELYKMALDQYNAEGADLMNQYGMLADQYNAEYGRFRDSIGDWENQRNYLADQYNAERNFDYGRYGDDRDFSYGQYSDDRNLSYNDYRADIADQQWQDEFDRSGEQWQKEFDRSGDQWQQEFDRSGNQWQQSFDYQKSRDSISDTQWQKEFDESIRQYNESLAFQKAQAAAAAARAASGGGGGGGTSTNSSNTSRDYYAEVEGLLDKKQRSTANDKAITDFYKNGYITREQMQTLHNKYGITGR